jgi:putative flippase GtrA
VNVAQPARFLAVGVAGYGVNLLAFAALYAAGSPYAAASVVAYLFSNALMYLGNRYFTFRLGHRGFWSAYARYLLVGLLVAGLTAIVLVFFVEVLGLHPTLGQAFGARAARRRAVTLADATSKARPWLSPWASPFSARRAKKWS